MGQQKRSVNLGHRLKAYESPENSPPRKRTRAADSVSLSDEELEAAKQNSEAAINRMKELQDAEQIIRPARSCQQI